MAYIFLLALFKSYFSYRKLFVKNGKFKTVDLPQISGIPPDFILELWYLLFPLMTSLKIFILTICFTQMT